MTNAAASEAQAAATSARPILITGANRSGTTWLATMLGAARDTLQIYEPFSMRPQAYRLAGLARHWHAYAPDLDHEGAVRAFQRVLDGGTHKVFRKRQVQRFLPFTRRGRPIIKDPIACFSAEWVAQNFDAQVVVLIRHPGAYAASLKRMDWRFDFRNLLRQERLMADWLWPFREEMEGLPDDIIDQAALFWKVIYHVLLGFANRNPDWLLRTHESLSLDPMTEIRELCQALALPWEPRLEERIRSFTSSGNPVDPEEGVAHSMRRDSAANIDRWKKLLSEDEAARVRSATEDIAKRFYGDETW